MYTLNATGAHGVAQPIAYNIAPGKGVLKDDIHITTADATKTLDASGSNPAMHQGGAAILQPIPFVNILKPGWPASHRSVVKARVTSREHSWAPHLIRFYSGWV